jgi:hypothetical protein
MQKSFSTTQRGQALILIALAAIGFFGITGLAIDGSAKFSDRRHAQNAADTAALAGALTLARDPTAMASISPPVPEWEYDGLQRALENGYDDNHVSNEVEIHSPPISGVYSNCSDIHFTCTNYVQVIIDSHVDTFFARVVGINQTHNHVEAVASKFSASDVFDIGGSAVVALSPEGCALSSKGGTNVVVDGGGLYSNSDDPTCAFMKESCAGTTDINNDDGSQGTITLVGGASLKLGCLPDASVAPGGSKQIPFPPPYEKISPPAACADPLVTISGNPSAVTLNPGHYKALPPKSNIKNMTLKPGVYCIDTEIRFGSTDTVQVEGTFMATPGVFLYIKPGGSFTINGGSSVNIWGINDNTSPYFGYLIYAAPDYSTGTPATCTMNGGSLSQFQGTIYAPYCNITLNGGSGPTGFQSQVVGYTVKFAGTSDIYLTYQAGSSPAWKIPLQLGLTK